MLDNHDDKAAEQTLGSETSTSGQYDGDVRRQLRNKKASDMLAARLSKYHPETAPVSEPVAVTPAPQPAPAPKPAPRPEWAAAAESTVIPAGSPLADRLTQLESQIMGLNEQLDKANEEYARLALHRLPSIRCVIETVSEFYSQTVDDVMSQRRNVPLIKPRQIACYLAKIMTRRSMPAIGRNLGGRDHTTVLYSIRKIEADIKTDSTMKRDIGTIKNEIHARTARRPFAPV